MELLAVSGLAYLGTILNQHIIREYDETEDKNINKSKKKEKFAFINNRKYKSIEGDKIDKNYNKRIREIRELSFIPEKSHVIPSFYNQIPSVLDEYENNKYEIPGKLEVGPITDSKKYSLLDQQFQFGKLKNDDPKPEGFDIEIKSNWTPIEENNDMTYGIFKKDELKHNNMQHFFRRRDEAVENIDGKMTDEINSNNNTVKMELFTGSTRNYYPKEAPPAFFEPMKDMHFVNGIPSFTENIKDRYLPGNQRQGEKPFQPVQVQPGLGLGYHEESKIGFQDPYRSPQPTIDFQRVGNRIQKSHAGVIIPGMKGQKQPVDPNVAKRRPEKAFDVSEYIHGGGNGGVSKPANNPVQIVKDQTRAFSMELQNGGQLASGSLVGPFNPDGIKRNPHKLQFDGPQSAGPNMESRHNNNLPSYNLLDNQRTETGFNYYDGPQKGQIMKNKQFNTQPANTTLRQTTAETPQDGTAYGNIRKVQQFNTQATNTTLRQTTAETSQDGHAFGDIRKVNQYNIQPTNTTLRQTTAETAQDGPAHGDIRQVHQFNTQSANTTLRQTTAETAQDGPAHGDIRQVHQFNTQATNTTLRQTTAETAQDGTAYGDVRQVHQFNTQPTNTTLRQTTAETAQDGAAYGDVRQVHQFNTQPTNTTLRQTTAETAQDGAAYGDVRKVHQFNTQPTNTTLRQTTAETAQDGPGFGNVRKVHQFNTQPTNSTFRQTTAETAQENPAKHTVSKVHLFNTQPANSTLRQVVNYDDYSGPTHVVVENLRSRSDANAMEVHSGREDTTTSRTLTYSGWHEGISLKTLGAQNSKEKDVNNNWTRVNPPSLQNRPKVIQDMNGFNLDDRIVYQLNKLKDYTSVGDRIETTVAEVLQNNELINNAYQKYGNKPNKLYRNIHDINK